MDTILMFITDLLLQYIGQFIRWLFFLGKKDFVELEDSPYNFILSILFFITFGFVFQLFK